MPRRHFYEGLEGLDRGYSFSVEVPMRKLVEQVVGLNHGAHRFLSHFVDVRRENLAKRIQHYRDRGDHDIAESVQRRGDPLADQIEKMLDEDLY